MSLNNGGKQAISARATEGLLYMNYYSMVSLRTRIDRREQVLACVWHHLDR